MSPSRDSTNFTRTETNPGHDVESTKPRSTRKHPRELIPGVAKYGHPVITISGERISESQWRSSQLALEMRGYLLRPRYSAYWRPSWGQRGTGILSTDEDAIESRVHASFCSTTAKN